MQKDDRNVLTFAAIVCITCSVLLSGAAALLEKRQAYNIELDRKINVLKAFGVDVVDEKGRKILTGDEVDGYFKEYISEVVLDGKTGDIIRGKTTTDLSMNDLKRKTMLPLYKWTEKGSVKKYAFPISGKGLWSTLYGYMALEDDLSTIIGITFYKHGETPGLGGECDQPWFQNAFKGKLVWENGKLLPFEVVKGEVANKYPSGNDHAVDGISGATITSKGIQTFLRSDLALYDNYFRTIRGS